METDSNIWDVGRLDRSLCPVFSLRARSSGNNISHDFTCQQTGWLDCAPVRIFPEYTFDVPCHFIDGGNLAVDRVLGDEQSDPEGFYPGFIIIWHQHARSSFWVFIYPVFCHPPLGCSGNNLVCNSSQRSSFYGLLWQGTNFLCCGIQSC